MSQERTDSAAPTSAALARAAREALRAFGVSSRARMRRLNDGENTTWRITPPRGAEAVLRLHRADYHSDARIDAELAWLDTLARDLPGVAPKPRASRDGTRIHRVPVGRTELVRSASLLGWTSGRFTAWPGSPNALHAIGALTAKLHTHARSWKDPAKSKRARLPFEGHVGDACHWGIAPLKVPSLTTKRRGALRQTLHALEARLDDLPRKPRMGLIHGDLHLGNVLVDGGVARAIDFDDCVRTWFMMDPAVTLLAAALNDDYARRRAAYWAGYNDVGGILSEEEQELLPSFQLLRIITMFAWSWTRSGNARIRAAHPHRQRLMLKACRVWAKSGGSRVR